MSQKFKEEGLMDWNIIVVAISLFLLVFDGTKLLMRTDRELGDIIVLDHDVLRKEYTYKLYKMNMAIFVTLHVLMSLIQIQIIDNIKGEGSDFFVALVLLILLMCAYAPIAYGVYGYMDMLCRSKTHHAVKLGRTNLKTRFFAANLCLQLIVFMALLFIGLAEDKLGKGTDIILAYIVCAVLILIPILMVLFRETKYKKRYDNSILDYRKVYIVPNVPLQVEIKLMKNDGSKVIEVNSAKHSVLIDSSRNIYVYDRASKEDVESYVLSENTKLHISNYRGSLEGESVLRETNALIDGSR